jgi:hypothetical protein
MTVSDQKIYLMGGWNGRKNLSDFWIWHIAEKRWECISQDVSQYVEIRNCF